MAQVLPAERGLRRVIGDGATVPDGEVEGLYLRRVTEFLDVEAIVRLAAPNLQPRVEA